MEVVYRIMTNCNSFLLLLKNVKQKLSKSQQYRVKQRVDITAADRMKQSNDGPQGGVISPDNLG
jgi:hypothetical protein